MECVQCGAELPEGSRFCSSCGAKQPEAAASEPAESSWPEARRVPDAALPGIGEPPLKPRSERENMPEQGRPLIGEEAAPPPEPGEPLAVRLTKLGGSASPGSDRDRADAGFSGEAGGEPPQMRADAPRGASRFAPPPVPAPSASGRAGGAERGRGGRQNDGGGSSARVWIAPPLLAICAAAALIWQVNYERGISAEAAEIQRSAADAALGGNYEIAESKLDQALDKRPRDPGIRSDLQTVQTIRRLEDQLTEAQRLLSRSDTAGATGVLDQVNRELSGLSGTAYDRLRDRLDKLRAKLELADIRGSAEKAGTLAELTGLLKTASAYPESEQQPVVELITDRIVEVSGDEAERAIAGGSYYEAAAVVDEARGYAPEAQRLIDLEKRLASLTAESEYAASELFEASGCELLSGTGELRMEPLQQVVKGGKLEFSGTLRNESTETLYDLLVEYRSYDAQGKFAGEGWTEVRPVDLAPGKTAAFSDRLDAEEGAIVVVDSVSWYRE
ncbi:hypothetical protein CDO73_08420 [Saccharibacillus sp. O23]|uniref:FxLYD domain-containing protein n=1 Tax=Saccharibacillus sp. O23 TaxID=2009338 RepID=UPI000B4E6F68|nr:FxLYD domain-containing protein [Saccharibacillus sp. O23]OWR31150.1 hypothetical protein CDO73_08420 [Saccharibacillus sp. O23]